MFPVRNRLASNVHSLSEVRCSVVKLARIWLTMNDPIVSVKQGKLRGAVLKSTLGPSYIAFKGIPFAAPPIGELRFKDPQPPAPWVGIKNAFGNINYLCMQLNEHPPYDVIGDEDCLYLNVYTNALDQSKPVMVWIHGGAFIVGNGSYETSRPDYLLARDVVLVSVNYRLGAFGFLNLGHRVAPGNQALKDLIAALEWIKENITNFGGDPNNVTIFGASAGGVLTQCLMLSSRAKGLFHKAIMQSGVVTCPWNLNQSRPERSFKLASILGKDSTNPEEVVEFLRTVPAKKIVKAQASILTEEEMHSYNLAFAPSCDDTAENPVLPLPIEALLAKDVDIPVMIGYTSHEFIMFFKDKSQKALDVYNKFLPQHVKNLAGLKKLGPAETEELLQQVKDCYFDGQPISEEKIDGLVDFITDVYFAIPSKLVVEDRVKRTSTPTYQYRYSYVGKEKTATDLLVKRLVTGASHVDEVAYLFYLPPCKTENPDPPAVGTKDRITMERMTRMWTNFAKTGNPTSVQDDFINVTWDPATTNNLCHLEIGDELKLLPTSSHLLSSK